MMNILPWKEGELLWQNEALQQWCETPLHGLGPNFIRDIKKGYQAFVGQQSLIVLLWQEDNKAKR